MNTNTDALRANFESWARHECCMPSSSKINWDAVWTKAAWDGYQAAHNAQQAIIDRLMLEYFPSDPSIEQVRTILKSLEKQ